MFFRKLLKVSQGIEPKAGRWRTWVISSGKDYRVAAPPGGKETKAELAALAELINDNDAEVQRQITYWDAGAPSYRWMDLISARLAAGTAPTSPSPCMTRPSRHGNPSTTTTVLARAWRAGTIAS